MLNRLLPIRRSAVAILPLVMIAAAGIAAYSNSTHGSFHYDDYSITENTSIESINPVKVWKSNNHFRFVGFYSFALNYRFSGLDDVSSWHYVNITLHILCAMLLYWFLFFLMKDADKPGSKIPLVAALLFVVHPVCSEPVNYIQARHVLFYTLFTLSGVLCAALFARAKSKTSAALSILGIAVSIALAAQSKEVGIFCGLATITLYLLIAKRPRAKNRRVPRLAIAAGVGIAAVTLIMVMNRLAPFSTIFQSGYHPWIGEVTYINYVLTGARTFWKYVALLLPLASRLNVDHHVMVVRPETFLQMLKALIPLLCMAAAIIVAFVQRSRGPIPSFLLLWAACGFLPYMLILDTGEFLVEYKMYFPALGFMGLAAFFCGHVAEMAARGKSSQGARIALSISFAALVIVCIGQTRARNRIWRDEFTLWNDAVIKSPEKARPYNKRGDAYGVMGEWDKAIADYGRALEINPAFVEAYNNRGVAYGRKGEYDKAIADWSRALKTDPAHASAYYNRGIAYSRKGEYDKAISDYSRALEIRPHYATAYNNRGNAHRHKGEYDKAVSDYSRALEIDPTSAKAYYNRAVTYFARMEYDKSWKDVNKMREMGYPVDPEFLQKLTKVKPVYSIKPTNAAIAP